MFLDYVHEDLVLVVASTGLVIVYNLTTARKGLNAWCPSLQTSLLLLHMTEEPPRTCSTLSGQGCACPSLEMFGEKKGHRVFACLPSLVFWVTPLGTVSHPVTCTPASRPVAQGNGAPWSPGARVPGAGAVSRSVMVLLQCLDFAYFLSKIGHMDSLVAPQAPA